MVDNVDEPQLSTTLTTGADGIAFGAAVAEPAALVQPFTVVVTLYVPALETVIDDVVAPVLHNNEPLALVDKVDEPQLSTTLTTGADGIAFGDAVAEPAALVQPFTVVVTLYVPALETVIDDVVAPVLHNNEPLALVDKVDEPQLSTTLTTGADGITFGDAVAEPAALVQPFTVVVTLYVPALETVIDDVVAPVLHNNEPLALVDKVDEPQLSTTLTTGADGIAFGDAVAEPAALVQPFTVVVTLYVPALETVIDDVVAPVLHNNEPLALVDKVDEPQLSTTVTTGIAGVVFGAATPEPAALVQPFTVAVTLYVPAVETVMVDVVAFVLHNSVPVAVVDKVDVPLQLSTTVTTGVAGVVFGAATPEPAALVQPFTVAVTLYVPAVETVMVDVVAFVLHNSVPVAVVDKVDVPLQLSTTVTTGVAGVVFGTATPEPAALVQPFTVAVTLYVPAVETVIDEVVALLLHNNAPLAVVDKVDVPLQLSVTETTGVAGVVFGAAVPEPAALVQVPTVCVTV